MNQKTIVYVLLSLAIILPHTSTAASSLLITEIMYNPEGADSGGKVSDGTYFSHEWVEIFNTSSGAIDLTGWKFNDGANHILNIPPEKGGQGSLLMPPGGYAILTDDAATFLKDHSGFSGTVIDTVMNLINTSKTISLVDAGGVTVDSVTYQNASGADENGYTLEKTDAAWKESTVIGGTPGAQNSAVNQPPVEQPAGDQPPVNQPPSNQPSNAPPRATASVNKIETAVNEVLSFDASDSYDPDGDALTFNWNFGDGNKSQTKLTTHSYDKAGVYTVILMISDGNLESYDNLTITVAESSYSTAVFINEFIPNPADSDEENEWIELINESDTPANISGWKLDDEETGSKEFTVPEETIIAPFGFLVFTRTQTNLALNNDGDTVRLILPNGQVFQEVTYEKSTEGRSAARFADTWSWQNAPTPGSRNLKETSQETAEQTADRPSGRIISSTLSDPSSPERTSEANNEENNLPSKKENSLAAIGASSSSLLPIFSKNGVLPAIVIALASAGVLFFLKRKLKSSL